MSALAHVELGEVSTIERSSIQPESIAAGTKYLGLEHIESGGRILGAQTVANGELASSKFRFSGKHLLYGKLRPYLAKIALPDFEGVCSTDILPVLPGPKLDRRYLCYVLRQQFMVDMANARSAGANLPRISPSELEKLQIPLPPLAEQKRIAGILDAADALRAKRREALAQLDSLLQATFLDLFGDPVTNPKGWERTAFGSLIISGPQNGVYKPSTDYGSGTRILRIDGFYDGVVTELASLKRVRVSDKEIALYSLAESDIVINRVNSRSHLGKCALVPSLDEPVLFESNMMRLKLDTRRMLPRFATQFLQTQYIKNQILTACKDAVNQSSINQTDVKCFQVLVPRLDVQQRFDEAVAMIDRQRTSYRAHLAELDALFASLQSRAFRGELNAG